MKDRLVFWGKKNGSEKVLLTIDLDEDEGTYEVQVMKAENVTEAFDNLVRNQWRNGSEDVVFPEIEEKFTRELSLTADLLPDEYEVDRDDLLKMAQAEWNFFVLSKRLKDTYSHSLDDLQERAEKLEEFSGELWEEMKVFWQKVQEQIRDKNLARRHGNIIRRRTNAIFSTLKDLRAKSEKELVDESASSRDRFMKILDGVEKQIEEGKSLRHLFDELKKIQRDFKKTKFTRKDQSAVWDKLDGLFKEIKSKKYGKTASGNDPLMRILRRIDGLTAAIDRMERSIRRDKKDLDFQNNRIDNTDGQLEAQIRKAKLSVLEERISSKENKLQDMHKTLDQLKSRAEKLKQKAEEEKKEEERKRIEKEVKERISQEIKEKHKEIESDPEVQKAASILGSTQEEKEKPSSIVHPNVAKSTAETIRSAVRASRTPLTSVSDTYSAASSISVSDEEE